MAKKIIIFLFISALLITGYSVYAKKYNTTDRTNTKTTEKIEENKQKETIRIAAIGDNIPHDTINLRAQTADGYDYTQFYKRFIPLFEASDAVFCNQESPSAGASLGISGYPTFNAPVEFSRDLQKIGCSIINLANNHVADKGEAGIAATRTTWDGLKPLAYAGANTNQTQQNTVSYFTIEGVKFAFLAFTDLSNNTAIPPYAINMFSESLVTSLTKEASSKADFVMVSAHWGVEDQEAVTSDQKKWAQLLSDNGADLIIGTGPHVLQTADKLKGANGNSTTVFYSLGNMLSTQLKLEELLGGVALIDINIKDKTISNVGFIPTYMHMEWTAEQEANEDLLARDNISIYPLSAASEPLSKTRFNASAETELTRIQSLLNQNIEVSIEALPN